MSLHYANIVTMVDKMVRHPVFVTYCCRMHDCYHVTVSQCHCIGARVGFTPECFTKRSPYLTCYTMALPSCSCMHSLTLPSPLLGFLPFGLCLLLRRCCVPTCSSTVTALYTALPRAVKQRPEEGTCRSTVPPWSKYPRRRSSTGWGRGWTGWPPWRRTPSSEAWACDL